MQLMIRSKYYIIISVFLIAFISVYGYSNRVVLKDHINWSSRTLNWNDFTPVNSLYDNYDAVVYSDIGYSSPIQKDNLKVYAYMDPNQSEWVKDTSFTEQLLIHEQFHFNLTEYCARLMRKEIVALGANKISENKMKRLYKKYGNKLDSLQIVYDNESDHNINTYEQRYWELYITDLLQQTAYYKNEDLSTYSQFTSSESNYFKHLYTTVDHQILSSYPISKTEAEFGESYQIIVQDSITTIRCIKDGKLTNGGTFNTAITTINTTDPTRYIWEYRDPDSLFNSALDRVKTIVTFDDKKGISRRYYNSENKRTTHNGVFELQYAYDDRTNSYTTSYFDKAKNLITNQDNVYHEKRKLDDKNRTIKITNLDKQFHPMLDIYLTAIYEITFGEYDKIEQYRLLNEKSDYAMHLDEYNIQYEYDERGNMISKVLLDHKEEPRNDLNGVSKRTYAYDLYDRILHEKRYNRKDIGVIGTEDYFQETIRYDSIGRIAFKAQYYPGFVLKFDESKWGATKYEYPNDSTKVLSAVDAYGFHYNDDRGISKTVYTLDSNNRVTEEAHYDHNGNYALTEDGVSIYTYQYDKAGNTIVQTTLDSLRNKVVFDEDVTTIRWKYDVNNNKTKTTYYNIDDELANAVQGVTYNNYVYDETGHLIERTNFNKHGKPENNDRAHRIVLTINRFGKDSTETLYDKSGRLASGAAITKYKYNSVGKITSTSYFSNWSKPTSNSEGIHHIAYAYTPDYKFAGYSNYNSSGRKINSTEGIGEEKLVYTLDGLVKSHSYLNDLGKPILGPEGYYKKEYYYNDAGVTTRISTYGTDNRLLANEDGIADFVYQILPSTIASRVSFFDADGNSVDDAYGVSEYIYSKELDGLYFIEQKLDANGDEILLEEEMEEEIETEE